MFVNRRLESCFRYFNRVCQLLWTFIYIFFWDFTSVECRRYSVTRLQVAMSTMCSFRETGRTGAHTKSDSQSFCATHAHCVLAQKVKFECLSLSLRHTCNTVHELIQLILLLKWQVTRSCEHLCCFPFKMKSSSSSDPNVAFTISLSKSCSFSSPNPAASWFADS